ncbi:hypothetical protein DPMN_175230 [Dreissena polymorpha]|uniref:Uncharacterized protein n=1 Tax=Dreissena polymorpha TaxID=45954 RepID=A0A9D4E4S5_DREPO|nr:hypothetical protein DPMN_175230 [Dreissena polymorpha]
MRSLKNICCLTHGSGYAKEMKNLRTLSPPVTSEYNSAMQNFTGLTIRKVNNTKTHLRCVSNEMLLISRKFRHKLQPAHPTQLILL